jgi:beta-lactamase class A
LLAQEFNERIPAGLPPGVKVAHKTGDITAVAHDAAIVYPPNRSPYVLVVLTKGIPDQKKSDRLIADLSRIIYEYNGRLTSVASAPVVQ